MTSGREDRRQRRVLIGLALMFLAPLALAFYLYYGSGGWRPGGRVNAGTLIEPVRRVPALRLPLLGGGSTEPNFLKGKWTLLYLAMRPCGDVCRARLYDTRQVRLALDRDMTRVQRVLIAGAECCDTAFLRGQHPDLTGVRAEGDALALVELLPGRDASGTRGEPVYLIDPLGNLMMLYPGGVKSKGMLEDIKRLLRLSSIG